MTKEEVLVPALAEVPLNRQRLFVRYSMAILIDLVVLNLFAEHTTKVVIAAQRKRPSRLSGPHLMPRDFAPIIVTQIVPMRN